jgi:hypothetical protein
MNSLIVFAETRSPTCRKTPACGLAAYEGATMIDAELLAVHFGRSTMLVQSNLEGLTHEQTLWSPSPQVNCINWLVGHLISSRSRVATIMGLTPVWDDETRARYQLGSAPITGDGDGVLPIERLAADFAAAANTVDAGLRAQTLDGLSGPAANQRFATRAEHLLYMHMHEAHHAGQIMTLREELGLAGIWPF